MIKKSRFILSLTVVSVSFTFGLCIGSVGLPGLFEGVNLTSIISSCTAIAGLSLAVLTYNRWLINKRRDDSYLVAKQYLCLLNEIRSTLREMDFQYCYLCPTLGMIQEPTEFLEKRLDCVNDLRDKLLLSRTHLSEVKSELRFWKVTLQKIFESDHDVILEHLSNIFIAIKCLNSQLYQLHINASENIQNVISCKEIFDKSLKSIVLILDKRLSLSFEDFFDFDE